MLNWLKGKRHSVYGGIVNGRLGEIVAGGIIYGEIVDIVTGSIMAENSLSTMSLHNPNYYSSSCVVGNAANILIRDISDLERANIPPKLKHLCAYCNRRAEAGADVCPGCGAPYAQ